MITNQPVEVTYILYLYIELDDPASLCVGGVFKQNADVLIITITEASMTIYTI